jgi:hypothetical protein
MRSRLLPACYLRGDFGENRKGEEGKRRWEEGKEGRRRDERGKR